MKVTVLFLTVVAGLGLAAPDMAPGSGPGLEKRVKDCSDRRCNAPDPVSIWPVATSFACSLGANENHRSSLSVVV